MARNLSRGFAVAVEEYAGFGHLHEFLPRREQAHQIFLVVNHAGKTWDVEAGVGFGLTDGSDKLTLKLILARDLRKAANP